MARTKHIPNRSTARKNPLTSPSGVPSRTQKEQQSDGQMSPRRRPSHATSSVTIDTAREPDAPSQGRSEQQQQQPKEARKPRRFKPGTVALREIRKLQKTWKLTIPFAPFVRLVKELTYFYSKSVSRWSPEALLALQEAAESHIIELLGEAYLCSIHAKRVTLMVKDIQLVRRISGRKFA